jgi:hypothetical protein
MQLNLALDLPEPTSSLWEQFDPSIRQAAIERLALAIAKATLNDPPPQENSDD